MEIVKNVIDFQPRKLKKGLGTTVLRLMDLVERKKRGLATDLEKREIEFTISILDQTILDFGFDCNADGIPDDIQENDLDFKTMVSTSCCRIPTENSPRRKMKDTSRKKTVAKKEPVKKTPVKRKTTAKTTKRL